MAVSLCYAALYMRRRSTSRLCLSPMSLSVDRPMPTPPLTPITTGIKDGKSGWSAREWRALISGIQEEARALAMPPVLYAIDHVHGTMWKPLD